MGKQPLLDHSKDCADISPPHTFNELQSIRLVFSCQLYISVDPISKKILQQNITGDLSEHPHLVGNI